MSIQFYPASSDGRPLLRCACEIAVEFAGADEEIPSADCPRCRAQLDTNERNGRDLLEYLGIAHGPLDMGGPSAYGQIRALELVKLCRARLAMVDVEAEIVSTERKVPNGPNVVTGGRSAGYMRKRTIELLVIATLAGPHWVAWS